MSLWSLATFVVHKNGSCVSMVPLRCDAEGKKNMFLIHANTPFHKIHAHTCYWRGVGVHVICLVCQGKQNWLWLTFYWHFSLVRDTDGCTPFMAAVRGRAYHAALTLFTTAQCLATNLSGQIDRNVVISMVCPSDSHPDASPLHVLCCNDTCSFTWTGTEHINQDIFECRTCGLTGSLCCCTECARVCHRGHDCK